MSDPDAPDEWVDEDGREWIACSICGLPVIEEPCPDHQPRAYARWQAITGATPTPEPPEQPVQPASMSRIDPYTIALAALLVAVITGFTAACMLFIEPGWAITLVIIAGLALVAASIAFRKAGDR